MFQSQTLLTVAKVIGAWHALWMHKIAHGPDSNLCIVYCSHEEKRDKAGRHSTCLFDFGQYTMQRFYFLVNKRFQGYEQLSWLDHPENQAFSTTTTTPLHFPHSTWPLLTHWSLYCAKSQYYLRHINGPRRTCIILRCLSLVPSVVTMNSIPADRPALAAEEPQLLRRERFCSTAVSSDASIKHGELCARSHQKQ